MDTKGENQKYEAFEFDPKYKNENQDQRYTRLLQEFDAKFAKIRWELPTTNHPYACRLISHSARS